MMIWAQEGLNWGYLAVSSFETIGTYHFMVPHHPPPSTPREASVILTKSSNKLTKMARNSAAYLPNVRRIHKITLNNCRLVEKHVQAALFILKAYWIQYFKIIFQNIINCMYKTLFVNPVTFSYVHGYHDTADMLWTHNIILPSKICI